MDLTNGKRYDTLENKVIMEVLGELVLLALLAFLLALLGMARL